MKFAPIICHWSLRSHCLTVGPNLTVAIENDLRSWDPSLTWQTTADYLQLLFSPYASSPTAWFSIRFSIRSSDHSGNGMPASILNSLFIKEKLFPPYSSSSVFTIIIRQTILEQSYLWIYYGTNIQYVSKIYCCACILSKGIPIKKTSNIYF